MSTLYGAKWRRSQAYHLAMREIKLLRATSHEHVVSVIEAFRSQSSGNVYLVRADEQPADGMCSFLNRPAGFRVCAV
jgi:hypothetical protein